tara:strand:- start:1401 stop:2576 length:1176 start_codon:yes stop_codon:yes gene_type:complete
MLSSTSPCFDLEPNFKKSLGNILYCNKHKDYFLDFFSSFSSLPFGYNPVFLNESAFYSECQELLSTRSPLCAFHSPLKSRYLLTLDNIANTDNLYANVLFAETGSLAVELALKVFTINSSTTIKIYTIENSFHGIYGLGGGSTIGSNFAIDRLKKIEELIPNFNCVYKTISTSEDLKNINNMDNSVLLLEPIQCTRGDFLLTPNLIPLIKQKQNEGLTLIVDEIQSGYLSTGSFWASQKYDLKPDIIVFGKKFQVNGCLLQSKYSHLLEPGKPKYFSSTFDASQIDMLRGIHFNSHLLGNLSHYKNRVQLIESSIKNQLTKLVPPHKLRVTGLFLAIDFDSKDHRDNVVKELFKNRILSNPTGSASIRFRSNLDTNNENISRLIEVLYNIL